MFQVQIKRGGKWVNGMTYEKMEDAQRFCDFVDTYGTHNDTRILELVENAGK